MTKPSFDSLRDNLRDNLREGVQDLLQSSPLQDFERNFKALLQGFAQRLDLVTREEFEAQKQVLMHTRARLQELEQRLK